MENKFSFIGEYCHSIDDKGRLALPGKLRDELSRSERPEEVVAYVNTVNGHLALYPYEQWRKVEEAVTRIPDNISREAMARQLGYNSERLTIDKSGRVLLNQKHRDLAALGREVVVLGGLAKIEVWERERLEQQRAKEQSAVAEVLRTVEVPL